MNVFDIVFNVLICLSVVLVLVALGFIFSDVIDFWRCYFE